MPNRLIDGLTSFDGRLSEVCMKIWQTVSHPLSPLVFYSGYVTVWWFFYLRTGYYLPALEAVALWISCWLTIRWMVADARRRQEVPCFDFGFLCVLMYPTSLIWYCISSRGWRGLLMLLLLSCLCLAPALLASVAVVLMH